MFRAPQTVVEYLREVLPAGLSEWFALEALEHRPGSFVVDALANRRANLVFEAPFRAREGRAAFLFEHRSSKRRAHAVLVDGAGNLSACCA